MDSDLPNNRSSLFGKTSGCCSVSTKGLAGLMLLTSRASQTLFSLSSIRNGSSLRVLLLANVINRGLKGEIVKVRPDNYFEIIVR